MLRNNKTISLVVCSLLLTSVFIDSIECARKSNTRHFKKSSSSKSRPSSSGSSYNSHRNQQKVSNNVPPPYQAHNGPPPAYAQQPGTYHAAGNVAPPSYQQGLGAGHVAPQYQQRAGYQQPGYNAVRPSYNSQPGYHLQPAYQPQPAYQQGYQQAPPRSGSNLGTNLAIGGVALVAGVGTGLAGAAVYNSLKSDGNEPKNSDTAAAVPLANSDVQPVHPNEPIQQGYHPGYQPQPSYQSQPMVPYNHDGLVLDPTTNTMINCTAVLMMANQHSQPVVTERTVAPTLNTLSTTDATSVPLAPMPTVSQSIPELHVSDVPLAPMPVAVAESQQPPMVPIQPMLPPQTPAVCLNQPQMFAQSGAPFPGVGNPPLAPYPNQPPVQSIHQVHLQNNPPLAPYPSNVETAHINSPDDGNFGTKLHYSFIPVLVPLLILLILK